jgi:hypothetical protein
VAPGNSDLCFEWNGPIENAVEHLASHGVDLELGPVARNGAQGQGTSVYFRDPDGSLMDSSPTTREQPGGDAQLAASALSPEGYPFESGRASSPPMRSPRPKGGREPLIPSARGASRPTRLGMRPAQRPPRLAGTSRYEDPGPPDSNGYPVVANPAATSRVLLSCRAAGYAEVARAETCFAWFRGFRLVRSSA